MTGSTCPECGAPLPASGECRDNFHALLALEWEVDAAPAEGRLAHFYAVSSYVLQHPDSMLYTTESLAWLRSAVSGALAGETTPEALRDEARGHAESVKVRRKPGDEVPRWAVRVWRTNVADVLAGGTEGYCGRVERWARSVVEDLEAARA